MFAVFHIHSFSSFKQFRVVRRECFKRISHLGKKGTNAARQSACPLLASQPRLTQTLSNNQAETVSPRRSTGTQPQHPGYPQSHGAALRQRRYAGTVRRQACLCRESDAAWHSAAPHKGWLHAACDTDSNAGAVPVTSAVPRARTLLARGMLFPCGGIPSSLASCAVAAATVRLSYCCHSCGRSAQLVTSAVHAAH